MYIVNTTIGGEQASDPFKATSISDIEKQLTENDGGYSIGPLEQFESGTIRGKWRNDIGQVFEIVAEKAGDK